VTRGAAREWEFPGEALSSLAWSSDGRVCLASFSSSPLLRCVYLSPSSSPSGPSPGGLDILPADLPVSPPEDSMGTPGGGVTGVSLMKWDPHTRLAVA